MDGCEFEKGIPEGTGALFGLMLRLVMAEPDKIGDALEVEDGALDEGNVRCVVVVPGGGVLTSVSITLP